MLDKIRQLIADDKLEKAIAELIDEVGGRREDLKNELIQHQATLTKNKNDSRRGVLTSEQENQTLVRLRYALLDIVVLLKEKVVAPIPPDRSTVFISYNHGDSDVAAKLKQALEKNGIVVHIDQAVMQAGANIQEFIERSIRDTDVTLSIVSNRSLLSAWVALESIYTFYHEKLGGSKKFIACYLDTDFFRNDFRLDATRTIDAEIEEIDKLIPEYIASKIDTNDLNSKKTRLFQLRNHLGDILERLRDSLSLDLRGERFEESVTRIVRELT